MSLFSALGDIDRFAALQAAIPDIMRSISSSTAQLTQSDASLLERELQMRLDLTTRASAIMEQLYMYRAVSHSYGDILKSLTRSEE